MYHSSAMALSIAVDPVPIRVSADGVALVGDTRVPIDTVVHAFERGWTPETIVRKFPTLRLPDVYAVVAYYLRHTDEVQAYLRERRAIAAEVRAENERRFPADALRERARRRRAAR
jgi:uncharacterized protein (DUF433 family)